LYRLASEQGDPYAQFNLGVSYNHGSGIEKDLKEAVHWYQLAANQGDLDAQFNLALCYKKG